MCSILSRSRRGTPRESLPLLLRSSVSSRSRRRMVASSPQVLLRQCRASSFTSSSVSAGQPWDNSSSRFALRSIETSAASHSKMHADSRDMKMGYSWWASVVHPKAILRIKCQMSKRITRSGQPLNLVFSLVSPTSVQHPQSTYNTAGGSTPACRYLFTRPSTIVSSPAPSWAVSTLMSTWPNSLPTEVSQSPVALAVPASFLVICNKRWYEFML